MPQPFSSSRCKPTQMGGVATNGRVSARRSVYQCTIWDNRIRSNCSPNRGLRGCGVIQIPLRGNPG